MILANLYGLLKLQKSEALTNLCALLKLEIFLCANLCGLFKLRNFCDVG